MGRQQQIVQRLAWLQAELAALTKLVEVEFGAGQDLATPTSAPPPTPPAAAAEELPPEPDDVVETAPEPAPKVAKAAPADKPKKKVRWRYVPGSWYRICGENPFRNGNNYVLFDYLNNLYGDHPFSREQLGQAIGTLARKGILNTVQGEETFVMVFLRQGGALRGAIEMSSEPADGGLSPKKAKVEASLPKEPGDVSWRLTGKHRFRRGSINTTLWNEIGDDPFTRNELTKKIEALLEAGTISSNRPAELVARTFVGAVVDRGLAEKVA